MKTPANSSTRSLILALILAGFTGLGPALAVNASEGEATRAQYIQLAQIQGRYGPYATMRRANEVASDFRRRGYYAIAFHNGDGYYVDVR